ncbi:hypothetical protein BKG95_05270 [Rodentibacter pneumotropicus]|uniref:DUF3077 domain-containing protein n=1 Tax=Rodentibacter pneumotropicus TaxID=758 RepID=A0AAW5LDT0_9PAST|nr:hypothetical protein [Rodentibacter pneumotropicus]MCQ9121942.1 hypothetical protein [Rodentibacter pneumotropicus]OOF68121.1 hypothetical protein BKG95_05270 [Rodentibacter pneumotropicus]
MTNQIPTHCALSLKNTGKLNSAIERAKAILTLIRNDGADSENLENGAFYTSEDVIRTALGVASDLLEQAEQSSKVDFYLTREGKGNE